MKNKIKTGVVKVKNHVKNNKFAYAASTVAVLAIWLQQTNKNDFYAFLTEKGIDPMEFYCPEYWEELNN